jgi:dTDP-4-dehydrorhamnose 3,5-epimerase
MKIVPLKIQGAWLLHSDVHEDDRGTFREWFLAEFDGDENFPSFKVRQANTSISKIGVVRGLHFSSESDGQAKIVTCTSGKVLDAIVDLRPSSSSFGQHVTVELDASEGTAVFISKGLGHGFQSLRDNSAITYLLDMPYVREKEFAINPLDPSISIPWQSLDPILSDRDKFAPTILEFNFLEKFQND